MDILERSGSLDFERFRLDISGRSLCRWDNHGALVPVALGGRAFDVLAFLVAHPGKLFLKSEIMDAVWPGVVVEESNLSVQISAIRRALDEGRTGASAIQTVPGRGYRFALEATRPSGAEHTILSHPPVSRAKAPPAPLWRRSPAAKAARRRFAWPIGLVAIVPLAGAIALLFGIFNRASPPPRMSIAVLLVSNADGTSDLARLADGISEELTIDLAQLWHAQVSSRGAVLAFRDQPLDPRGIGRALNVRYLLEGSLRRNGDGLHATAALLSGETGEVLRVDQIDVTTSDKDAQQNEIRGWLTNFTGNQLVIAENARSARERPANPDALDLGLQARALLWQQSSAARSDAAQALLERALRLDPNFYRAMAGLVYVISEQNAVLGRTATGAEFERAESLMARAEALAPTDLEVLFSRAYLLRHEQRWSEAAAAFEHLLSLYPHDDRAIFLLGICKLQLGLAEEAIPLFRTVIRLNPRSSNLWARSIRLGQALLLAGRNDEAVVWLRRGVVADPERPASVRVTELLWLVSADALCGHIETAREELATARSIYPYSYSVRSLWATANANEAVVAQLERVREGLRLAGLRDHVDEDEAGPLDVEPGLHRRSEGLTPQTILGARVVRTPEVVELLAAGHAVVLDGISGGKSIQGAKSVAWIGPGGSLSDSRQEFLARELRAITQGDVSRPIIALGLNAEHWSGYDLALRVASLGYKNVFWYRGGREAWAAAGLPTDPVRVAAPLSKP